MLRFFVGFSLGQNFECFVNNEVMKQNTKVMTDSPIYKLNFVFDSEASPIPHKKQEQSEWLY